MDTRTSEPTVPDRRKSRVALLEQLTKRGLLPASEARHVASVIEESDEPLDEILCKLGLVTEDRLAVEYAAIYGAPRFLMRKDKGNEAFAGLNRRFLYLRRIAPLRREGARVVVIVVDPSDEEAIKGLSFALGAAVVAEIATASEFENYFTEFFPDAVGTDASANRVDPSADVSRLKDMASAEPVVRYVSRLITEASRRRASDIHIELGSRIADVRFRIDGRLADFETIPVAQALSAISRLKILAELDIAEQRRPQDGRTSFPVAGRAIDLRLSTNPTVDGESLVIRLLDQYGAALELDALGFSPGAASTLHSWIERPNGIILLTGPTGSGKTTTLYALLRRLAEKELKILTIEDPVEYRIDGILQTQVNPDIGLDFPNALRSFLRHDPDVIMVGEMRDLETARTAIQAALTGHLVLSTLHTNDAPSAIVRLIDMGVDDYLVASTLVGVVAQRLIRRVCAACGGGANTTVPDRSNCQGCLGSGYAGRLAICELLPVDDALRAAIKKNASAPDLAVLARASGFRTMAEDGDEKITVGVTTRDEVAKAILR
ncbi:MAG TPA: GspE/PulE family protein [Parvularculaceae bacterium]|nr:GspE/PulE family protein [Parvularculaceae bacterium]